MPSKTKQQDFTDFLDKFNEFKQNPEFIDERIKSYLEKDKSTESLTETNEQIQKLLQNENFKKDISSDQDLTVALMNLIGIEEHLFFTGAKTGKTDYYDLITVVRDIRKSLLGKIIKEYEGEVWCISKHLLASSYRLMEVGTKQLDLGRKDEAYELFDKAFSLYCLFWGINKNIFSSKAQVATEMQKIGSTSKSKIKTSVFDKLKNFAKRKKKEEYIITPDTKDPLETGQIMSKLKMIVKKIVDCCIE